MPTISRSRNNKALTSNGFHRIPLIITHLIAFVLGGYATNFLRRPNFNYDEGRLPDCRETTTKTLRVADAIVEVEQATIKSPSKHTSPITSRNNDACNADALSMDPPADEIRIDYAKLSTLDNSPLERLKDYTREDYVKYMLAPAGKEHYPLLNYLSSEYGDCRHFVDIGTRYVTSALTLGSNRKTPVWTFDLPQSKERQGAFRGKTEEEWQRQVRELGGVNITFHNVDLLKVSNETLKTIMGNTWFTMLDTAHLPYTVPFEREFLHRMIHHVGYKGILGLDDIHLNNEMKRWWVELKENAERDGYVVYDVTKVGHASGTGLIDFSGKVKIVE